MTFSTPTLKQLQRVDDLGGLLVLLTINHTSFATPIYLVADTRPCTSNAILYTASPFRFKLPQDKQKETPRAQLEIDNVGRDITAELEGLPPGASLMATVVIVHRNTPDVVEWQFTSPMSGIRATMTAITANMGPDDIMRLPAVRIRFDQRTAPGLVPG